MKSLLFKLSWLIVFTTWSKVFLIIWVDGEEEANDEHVGSFSLLLVSCTSSSRNNRDARFWLFWLLMLLLAGLISDFLMSSMLTVRFKRLVAINTLYLI